MSYARYEGEESHQALLNGQASPQELYSLALELAPAADAEAKRVAIDEATATAAALCEIAGNAIPDKTLSLMNSSFIAAHTVALTADGMKAIHEAAGQPYTAPGDASMHSLGFRLTGKAGDDIHLVCVCDLAELWDSLSTDQQQTWIDVAVAHGVPAHEAAQWSRHKLQEINVRETVAEETVHLAQDPYLHPDAQEILVRWLTYQIRSRRNLVHGQEDDESRCYRFVENLMQNYKDGREVALSMFFGTLGDDGLRTELTRRFIRAAPDLIPQYR